jgi:hypothetical protein
MSSVFTTPGSQTALERALAGRLGGGAPRVVWSETGDEVLVHLDSLKAQAVQGTLVMGIDLEADETPRERVIVRVALGKDRQGRLVGVTDERPDGKGLLAARWGRSVQDALWSAVVGIVTGEPVAPGARPPRRTTAPRYPEIDAVLAIAEPAPGRARRRARPQPREPRP